MWLSFVRRIGKSNISSAGRDSHTMKRCRKTSMKGFAMPLLLFSLLSFLISSSAVDTISKNQFISDGKTIVSSDESFEMGFFSPGDSKNRYVGIWYKKISHGSVVWIANREIPLTDTFGVLKVIDSGILVLFNSTNHTIWSTNTSRTVQNPIVQLLDSGNLVVRDANDNNNPENFLWQGFDYPCDTLLPGMKVGKNLVTGHEWYISSWKSKDDPAKGDYEYWLDLHGYPQFFISNGHVERFRPGPWNGLRFSGTPGLKTNPIYKFGMHFERQGVYYEYDLYNSSVVSRLLINSDGILQRLTWVDRTQSWVQYQTVPLDSCDAYKQCGPYGSCDVNKSPTCNCLEKFVPKYPNDWERTDWSGGCVRRVPLDCENGDGFATYLNIKLPDTRNSWYNVTMTLGECKEACLKNCSCMAYSNLNISGGSGCLLWSDELVDMREFIENGQDIYIRIASSDLDSPIQHGGSNDKKKVIIIVPSTLFSGLLLLGLCIMSYIRKRKKNNAQLKIEENYVQISTHSHSEESQNKDLELPLFDFNLIASCTNNFSTNNKLGEGGFGLVHKGRLEDGREIAVKRLSKTSRQGPDEFKNEVICIAKLQHRNLVKLLGFCIQGEERMLIYEFMPNKSLDSFIFDEGKKTLLDWPKRYNIINGIARGLLYLHQDSRLRIIHRDLKASNILLDLEMNPKISDFGMAKCFGGNETAGNTSRVVGTYGYMSPEYAVDGLFSVKSDVFSFGVLVLEIVSGKRNRGFFHPDHYLNLLGHAWTLYEEDMSIELIDPTTRDSCYPSQVLRSIHVGLLCVQQHPEDRPSMSSVVLMLGSEGSLPCPKQPGFFTERNRYEAGTSSSKNAPSSTSTNYLTNTVMEPR